MHDAVDCGVDLFGGHRAKCAPRERRPQAEIAEVVAKDQCVCGQTGSVGHAVFGQLFETRRTHVLRHSLTGQNGSERQQVRNASAVLIPRVERSDQIGPNLVEVNAVSGVRRERIASGHDAHLAGLLTTEDRRDGHAVNHWEIGEIENRGHYQNLTFSGAFIARGGSILCRKSFTSAGAQQVSIKLLRSCEL